MAPMRLDPVAAFERTISITNKMVDIVNGMDSEKIFSMMREGKTLETIKWLEENVLR